MDTVCEGKDWDVALAYDSGRLAGAMPYLYGRRMGMTYIVQPQMTQYTGPFYCYPDGAGERQRAEFEIEVSRQLIRHLEERRAAFTLVNFSPLVTNWLPFYWAGYRQTTRYTYRIDDISDPRRVFEAFDREKRQRKIRRYEQTTALRYDMEPAAFARFHHRYWSSKGKHDLLSEQFIERVSHAAIQRGSGVIASLHDADGNLLAARFVAYDDNCAYSLLSALDMSLHRSGHSETLMWGLIKHLADKTRAYDFEGSMDEGIGYFYRSFGARQVPYFEISRFRGFVAKRLAKRYM